jgi:hypothetical protein
MCHGKRQAVYAHPMHHVCLISGPTGYGGGSGSCAPRLLHASDTHTHRLAHEPMHPAIASRPWHVASNVCTHVCLIWGPTGYTVAPRRAGSVPPGRQPGQCQVPRGTGAPAGDGFLLHSTSGSRSHNYYNYRTAAFFQHPPDHNTQHKPVR